MTLGPVLITSFRPWRSHQLSNSSDDLLIELQRQGQLPFDSVWIRNLPVSFELAPIRVISELYRHRPRAIVCCGMAEKRACLSIEKQARKIVDGIDSHILTTATDVNHLIADTCLSEVSDDAGKYVCNHLYYSVLENISTQSWSSTAIFAHIPRLSTENKAYILRDFSTILARL